MSKFYKLPMDIAARRDLKASDKVLYAILADRVGSNGSCWPGVRTLAKDSGFSQPAVLRSICSLESADLIKVQRGENGQVNRYRLSIKRGNETLAVQKPDRSQNVSGGANETLAEPLTKRYHNQTDKLTRPTTIINSDLLGQPIHGCSGRKKKAKVSEKLFDEFWAAYPRKVGKGAARRAFIKHKPNAELLKVMLKALRWQKESEQWLKDNGQYIPHPSTWLNQERWSDEKPAGGWQDPTLEQIDAWMQERERKRGPVTARVDEINVLRAQIKRRPLSEAEIAKLPRNGEGLIPITAQLQESWRQESPIEGAA